MQPADKVKTRQHQQPENANNPLVQLLLQEKIDEFNTRRAAGETCDCSGVLFRGLDLRGMQVTGISFKDAYFRGADVRGVDFRQCNLEGVSMAEAKVSGCYFPKQLSAAEIRLSVERGTRMRYSG